MYTFVLSLGIAIRDELRETDPVPLKSITSGSRRLRPVVARRGQLGCSWEEGGETVRILSHV